MRDIYLYEGSKVLRNLLGIRDQAELEKAVQFSDSLAKLWKIHPFREGNTRTTVTFCCQYADEIGLRPNRELFEDNAAYVRTALVAYNAVFADIGDVSKPDYLIRIIEDSLIRGTS
jgi:cell filamentation protein